jgi:hypothetical protein
MPKQQDRFSIRIRRLILQIVLLRLTLSSFSRSTICLASADLSAASIFWSRGIYVNYLCLVKLDDGHISYVCAYVLHTEKPSGDKKGSSQKGVVESLTSRVYTRRGRNCNIGCAAHLLVNHRLTTP